MIDLTRRKFLTASAAASLAPAIARAQSPGKLSDIDHIIVLMKENRSFDHYFGTLSGVRGFDDPAGRAVFRQPDADSTDGYALPFRLDTTKTNAQRLYDLSHEWGPQHASWADGKMDGWLATHRKVDRAGAGPLTMGYLTRADLPFYYALADAFTICDGYHCSMLGPTHPNRYLLMTGTVDPAGKAGGPAITNNGRRYGWETYPERLERAGISWRVYHDLDDYDCNVLKFFAQYQGLPATSPLRDAAIRNRPFYELLEDLRTGNIPQVTWIVAPSHLSEHPDWLPAAGEDHTSRVLGALWSNPKLWAKTALILNYDENDGQFDHVAPPTPEPGTADEFIDGQPIGLGFRVPCLMISPWSRGGYVCSRTFDHTSVLRLIEARFGVEIANLSAWRRATCGDLTATFDFSSPRLDLPTLPETEQALARAERSAMELPRPAPPAVQTRATQEPGTRPRRG